jgi:hypothetical protein
MNAQLKPLFKTLDESYAKLPALPKKWTDLIVHCSPWLALLGAIAALLIAFGLYQGMTYVNTFAFYAGVSSGFSIPVILAIVVLLVWAVIYFLAFSPLKARKEKGWNLILYGMLLSVLSDVVRLSIGDIIFGIVGFLIGYYFLYQVKSYYK